MYSKEGFLELGVAPEQAPDKPTYITIHFEKGVPTAIDGKEMKALEIVEKLNELGGANGIGLLDIVENRLVHLIQESLPLNTSARLQDLQDQDPRVKDAKHSCPLNSLFLCLF